MSAPAQENGSVATLALPPHVPADLVVDADIYDLPGAAQSPQLAWKALQRTDGPGVVWTPRNGGHWIVTSADLIWEFFPDLDRLSARDISVPPGLSPIAQVPNQSDEPEHASYRKIIMPFLLPGAVRRRMEQVRVLTIELIEGFHASGRCEFIQDFARQLPMLIFLSLVDLPATDRERLVGLADAVVRTGDPEVRARVKREMAAYLQHWIDARREQPGDDMLSAIVHGMVGARPMTADEVMGEALNVMFGGLDTVASMMGFIMQFLATHPDHYRQLVDDPARIPLAVEEMLRRFAVASVGRRVTREIRLDGVTLRPGDMLILPTCLHGLDPRKWDDPDAVDFGRRRQTHATFGTGVHTCPGAGLARSEIAILIEEWTRRIPRFGLAPGSTPLGSSGAVNGMIRLDLAWPVPTEHHLDRKEA